MNEDALPISAPEAREVLLDFDLLVDGVVVELGVGDQPVVFVDAV